MIWVLISVVCSTADVHDCKPMIWKDSFPDWVACTAMQPTAEANPPAGTVFLMSRCVSVPLGGAMS